MEIWKKISDNYQVSNLGRVKNKKGKILKPYISSTGYLKVHLDNGKQEYVHRLVATAFCENKGNCVDHLNGNKKDNRAENLEWVSTKENIARSIKLGLANKHKKRIYAYKGTTGYCFKSICEAAKTLNVSLCAIRSALINGYATSGYRWTYA